MKMFWQSYFLICLLLICASYCECKSQVGPDPWDEETTWDISKKNVENIPPDLMSITKNKISTNISGGIGDWFYKRLLAIIIKGGQIKKNEDGSTDVSLQMFYTKQQWEVLEEYLRANLSEDMYRRSIGLIEEAIYKPTIGDRIVMAWDEYIKFYLIEYKTQITTTLTVLSVIILTIWIWNHASHRHVIIGVLIGLYLYEAFVSYKEAEKQELEKFMKAVNACKWFFWSSECDVPPPDILIFLKHLNPLKIVIRMFSTIITEPMLLISDTIKIMIHGLTDGLWYPLDKLMYGFLIILMNVLLIFLLIMIVFNYILNIPFDLNFLGLVSVGLRQRNRQFKMSSSEPLNPERGADRISGETINKLLDVCSRALNTRETTRHATSYKSMISDVPIVKLTRSSSEGRLSEVGSVSWGLCVKRKPREES